MRILVVDDEVDLTEAIARGLRRQGYAVDTAIKMVFSLLQEQLYPSL